MGDIEASLSYFSHPAATLLPQLVAVRLKSLQNVQQLCAGDIRLIHDVWLGDGGIESDVCLDGCAHD